MENLKPETPLTFVELCTASGLKPEIVHEYQLFGLFPLHPVPEPERFSPAEITHLQLVQRLHEDLEINLQGIEVILRLRSKLEKMERTVAQMQHQLTALELQHFQRLYHDLVKE